MQINQRFPVPQMIEEDWRPKWIRLGEETVLRYGYHETAVSIIRRQLSQLKVKLIGEDPQTIEKMLGDQVIATWLEVKYLETTSAEQKGATIGQAALVLKKVESAQRRHLNAIRSLVQTRKLLPTGGTNPVLRIFPGDREAG